MTKRDEEGGVWAWMYEWVEAASRGLVRDPPRRLRMDFLQRLGGCG